MPSILSTAVPEAKEPTMSTPDPKPDTPDPKPAPTAYQQAMANELLNLVLTCTGPNGEKCSKPRQTSRGTPCARSWNDEWIAKVEAAEQRLDRQICGARTRAGNPCELAPNHENGRCRFHGGFQLTGAQKGNRNAAVHGLYSRRLRVCDATCPLANACPCPGPDLDAVPAPDRPTCPYEQAEYNAALTDALDRVSRNPNSDALDLHTAHNLALLQVMFNRAAIALRNAPLVDETTASTGDYQMKSTKISAHLDALTRIAREYRHFAAMLKAAQPEEPHVQDFLDNKGRATADTGLDPDKDALLHPGSTIDPSPQARRYLRQAVKCAAAGNDVAAIDAVTDAACIAPSASAAWEDRVLAAYRPKGAVLPEQAFKKIIKYTLKQEGRLSSLLTPPKSPSDG